MAKGFVCRDGIVEARMVTLGKLNYAGNEIIPTCFVENMPHANVGGLSDADTAFKWYT